VLASEAAGGFAALAAAFADGLAAARAGCSVAEDAEPLGDDAVVFDGDGAAAAS
jgi:hypothetical protein